MQQQDTADEGRLSHQIATAPQPPLATAHVRTQRSLTTPHARICSRCVACWALACWALACWALACWALASAPLRSITRECPPPCRGYHITRACQHVHAHRGWLPTPCCDPSGIGGAPMTSIGGAPMTSTGGIGGAPMTSTGGIGGALMTSTNAHPRLECQRTRSRYMPLPAACRRQLWTRGRGGAATASHGQMCRYRLPL